MQKYEESMNCDVVIVGAGPAGSATAYYLRDSGLDVILIDRLGGAQFTRYHTICGSALSRRGIKRLDLHDNEILNSIDTLKIEFPGDRRIRLKAKGYVISRPNLLYRLRSESVTKGVKFIHGSVTSIQDVGDEYSVALKDGTSFKCKFIVGADGCYSVVRKSLFGSNPQIMLKVEEWHFSGKCDENVLEFVMSSHASQLYSWRFPYGDQICTGSLPAGKSAPEGTIRGIRSIPLGHVGSICKKNTFLVGDAAGLPNPMTAGGLSVAFLSAYRVARAIIKNNPQSYQKWWNHYRGSDIRFLEVHNTISSFSDDELVEFSDRFNHNGLWWNGFSSVIHHSKFFKLYIGCLLSLRYGW